MINRQLVSQRLDFIEECLEELKKLSSLSAEEFFADKRNVAAAESYLRRSLEAVFDVGRHILAKTGAADLAMEYKSIARGLQDKGFVSESVGVSLRSMAGYRNRLVHLYHLIKAEELFQIIREDLHDLRQFVAEIARMVQ